ncbi:hypothetical protein BHE74_00008768 [Ensete ventricosum]|nr:hypothetical protein BHE74_00008768 [Ensete ventricosum]
MTSSINRFKIRRGDSPEKKTRKHEEEHLVARSGPPGHESRQMEKIWRDESKCRRLRGEVYSREISFKWSSVGCMRKKNRYWLEKHQPARRSKELEEEEEEEEAAAAAALKPVGMHPSHHPKQSDTGIGASVLRRWSGGQSNDPPSSTRAGPSKRRARGAHRVRNHPLYVGPTHPTDCAPKITSDQFKFPVLMSHDGFVVPSKVSSSPRSQRDNSGEKRLKAGGGAGVGANISNKERECYSLRSRGLCLVPVASTLKIAQSNGADLWAPNRKP